MNKLLTKTMILVAPLLLPFMVLANQATSCLPNNLIQQYAHNINTATGIGKTRNIALLNARANLAKQLSSQIISELQVINTATSAEARQQISQTTWQQSNTNVGSFEILAACTKAKNTEVLILNTQHQKQQFEYLLTTLKNLSQNRKTKALTMKIATSKQKIISGQVAELTITSAVSGHLSLFSCGINYCHQLAQQTIQPGEITIPLQFNLPKHKNQQVITTTEWLWATIAQTALTPEPDIALNNDEKTPSSAPKNYWHYWLNNFQSHNIQANTVFTITKY